MYAEAKKPIYGKLVMSGPAGTFCVWGNFQTPVEFLQGLREKKLEKQSWWSITETSYAATNF